MSLDTLCLGLYLLLIGLVQVFSISISATLLGVLALIAGALILIGSVHPITVYRRPPAA
jgi:hypothetical protein